MAFDDITLFEMHFDGATFGSPSRGEDVDDVVVTDPDRMDPEIEGEEAVEMGRPSRGRRVIGVAAVAAAVIGARAIYRRRARSDEGAAVAVESVDYDDEAEAEPEPVEQ